MASSSSPSPFNKFKRRVVPELSLFPPDDGHLETYGRGSLRGVGLEIGQNWSLNHTIKDNRIEERIWCLFFEKHDMYWFYSFICAKMKLFSLKC